MTRIEFDYAWGWFQYHAAQRLTSFNFFLIITGLLLVAFAQAIDHDWTGFGFGIGLLGTIVAAGFLALDVRNEELVNRGRHALGEVEGRMRIALADLDEAREYLCEALGERRLGNRVHRWVAASNGGRDRSWLFKHRFWLRCVIGSVGFGFAVGAIWALFGYCGT